MSAPATRHRCSLTDRTFHPTTWRTGRPTSKRCGYCGGAWVVCTGYWTVQVWRGDGRYTLDSAVEIARTEKRADARALALNGDTHCTRFITT